MLSWSGREGVRTRPGSSLQDVIHMVMGQLADEEMMLSGSSSQTGMMIPAPLGAGEEGLRQGKWEAREEWV